MLDEWRRALLLFDRGSSVVTVNQAQGSGSTSPKVKLVVAPMLECSCGTVFDTGRNGYEDEHSTFEVEFQYE